MRVPDKSSIFGRRQALAALAIVVVLIIIQLAEPARGGLWLRKFQDSLRVPSFSAIAVSLLLGTPEGWDIRKRIAVVMSLVIGMSMLGEAAQIPIDRDASIAVFFNLAGAAGFLAIAATFVRGLPASTRNQASV